MISSVCWDFLAEAELDQVGCFSYSPVEGATANQLPNPVPEEVKQERLSRLMEVAGNGQRRPVCSARSIAP